MTRTLQLLTFLMLLSGPLCHAQNLKAQKKYFPKAIKKMKVYLGSTEAQLLEKCPSCRNTGTQESFRRIYAVDFDDKQFEKAFFYVSKPKAELYEMLLIAKEGQDPKEIAVALLGSPNAENEEWRFYPNDTGFSYTIAAWIFNNKLIIAGTLKGSEWETGLD